MTQLLSKHGIDGRLVTYPEVSREGIATFEAKNAMVICIIALDIEGTPAYLRYLIQRLKGRLGNGSKLIVGLSGPEDPAASNVASFAAPRSDVTAKSLEDALAKCVELSVKVAEPAMAVHSI
jgi:hypothetical protein